MLIRPLKLKYIIFVALFSGVLVFVAMLVRGQPDKRVENPYTPTIASPTATTPEILHGKPVRLVIPSLSINAKVEHVGLTSSGDMDAPKELSDAGWFMYGSHPGDEGSAVIAGHVGGQKAPGIFANLFKMQAGEKFSVIDDSGQTVNFKVREVKTYGMDDQPEEVFRSKNGKHMNLITCTGTWNEDMQTYMDRLVVFADKSD